MNMNYEELKRFKEDNLWLYMRLKSGRFYKCKIVKLGIDSCVILDRYDITTTISLDFIELISVWREK